MCNSTLLEIDETSRHRHLHCRIQGSLRLVPHRWEAANGPLRFTNGRRRVLRPSRANNEFMHDDLEVKEARTPVAARLRDVAVLIVEDHPVVAFGTAEVIKRRLPGFRPAFASNAREALARLDEREWRWILLDFAIPVTQGLSLLHVLHARGLAHRCCVISADRSAASVREARQLGVAGYIDKRLPFDAFCEALDRVLRGHPVFPKVDSRRGSQSVALTARQAGILRLIQRGRSSKQIAYELGIAEGTARNHTLAILRALGVTNRTHAVTRGIELGILPPVVAS